MTDLLVTVNFKSADPTQGAVSSFAIKSDIGAGPAVTDAIMNAVEVFYLGNTGQTKKIGEYLSSLYDRTADAQLIKVFDITGHLDGSPHGSPIAEGVMTLPAAASFTNLPPQVACVMTLRGRDALAQPVEGAGGTRPRARRTGRMYVGALNSQAQSAPANDTCVPSTAFRTDLTLAAENFSDALTDGDTLWCIWSRTNASMSGIERVEVDNSWDVLRSRKSAPFARLARTFAPEPAPVLAA